MYNSKDIDKKLDKLSSKKNEKKIDDILSDNKISIAKFYLFPDQEFVQMAIKED